MSFINRLSQNVTVDSANSFSGTIVAGTTWNAAGTGTSTLGTAGIQIVVKSNKNLTVYVEQGRTNSSFQIMDTYSYNAQKNNFGITVQTVGQFVRVSAKNVDATDATVTVDTLLCPIIEAVPRSLDNLGNFQTTISGLGDQYDNEAFITHNGMLSTQQPYRLVGTVFGNAIDTAFWTATNSGTGSASGVANGIATISSGTATNAYGNLTTVRSGRFIFANPNKYRGAVRMTNLTQSNTVRRWGAYTTTGTPPAPVDGHYFELSATNVLSVNCINNGGTPVSNASGTFNGDVSTYTMDTNVHIYEILFYVAQVQFYIDNVLIHTHVPTTTPLSATNTLPVTVTATKSANQADNATIEVWSANISRQGRPRTAPRTVSQAGVGTAVVLKNGPGRLKRIISSNGTGAGSIILYDAITATNAIGTITVPASTAQTLECQIDFYTGLTISTTGGNTNTIFVYE